MARLQILDFFSSFTQGVPTSVPDGTQLQTLVNQLFTYQNSLTANASNVQASAIKLTAAINEISTASATTAGYNGVMLAQGLPGNWQFVINDGANGIQVYGNVQNPSNNNASDTIAAHGSATQSTATIGVAQASATIALYVCFKLGSWKQFLTS